MLYTGPIVGCYKIIEEKVVPTFYKPPYKTTTIEISGKTELFGIEFLESGENNG